MLTGEFDQIEVDVVGGLGLPARPDSGGSKYLDDVAPSASLIEQAQRIVDLIEEELLFARVDGVEIDRGFQLMELELIEPALFLRQDSLASQRFAEAIVSLLTQ